MPFFYSQMSETKKPVSFLDYFISIQKPKSKVKSIKPKRMLKNIKRKCSRCFNQDCTCGFQAPKRKRISMISPFVTPTTSKMNWSTPYSNYANPSYPVTAPKAKSTQKGNVKTKTGYIYGIPINRKGSNVFSENYNTFSEYKLEKDYETNYLDFSEYKLEKDYETNYLDFSEKIFSRKGKGKSKASKSKASPSKPKASLSKPKPSLSKPKTVQVKPVQVKPVQVKPEIDKPDIMIPEEMEVIENVRVGARGTIIEKTPITEFEDTQVSDTITQTTGRTNVTLQSFESLYPKQTQQLIKLGQDNTKQGKDITEIRQNIKEKVAYFEKSKIDQGKKLVNLGKSVTDSSKSSGLSSIIGGIGLTGVLIIGGVLIFTLLRK